MEKVSLGEIWSSYFKTLKNYGTGNVCVGDVVLQIILPILVSLLMLALLLSGEVCSEAIEKNLSNIVTGVSVVSSLLCAVAVMLFQLRVQIDSGINGVVPIGKEVELVDELFHDVMWAIVMGFSIVLMLIISQTDIGDFISLKPILEALAVGCGMNFVLVICMSIKRLSASY